MFLPRLIKLSGKPQYVTCIFRAFLLRCYYDIISSTACVYILISATSINNCKVKFNDLFLTFTKLFTYYIFY